MVDLNNDNVKINNYTVKAESRDIAISGRREEGKTEWKERRKRGESKGEEKQKGSKK